MNRGEIRDEIRRLVKDTDTTTSRQRWSDTVLNTRIDQSHDRISAITRCIIDDYDLDLVSGTQEYTLPSYFLQEEQVLYLDGSGNYVAIGKRSENEMNMESAYWRATEGSDLELYYIRSATIGFYPKPNFSRTGGVKIWLAKRPTAFSADADIPFDSLSTLYPFHDTICFEVAYKCKMDEGKYDEAAALNALLTVKVREMQFQVSSENQQTRIPNIYEYARSGPRRTR